MVPTSRLYPQGPTSSGVKVESLCVPRLYGAQGVGLGQPLWKWNIQCLLNYICVYGYRVGPTDQDRISDKAKLR